MPLNSSKPSARLRVQRGKAVLTCMS
jgi:hypothetical protein